MKKLIFVLIMISLSMGFITCKKNDEKLETSKKTYIVGTDAEYPPYEYLENNKIIGFDADIIEELSKRVGFNYKWSNMNFDGLISALQSKKIDILIAGMTITKEREKFINFSLPYISPNICYLVLKNKNYKDSKELEGKKFGVVLGTTEEAAAKKIPGVEIMLFSGYAPALLALKAYKIDAMIIDEIVAKKFMEKNPEIEITGAVAGGDKAMAFNKDDIDLKNNIDIELEKMLNDGTIQNLKEKHGM